jgi:PAS domain S-box-containing protein
MDDNNHITKNLEIRLQQAEEKIESLNQEKSQTDHLRRVLTAIRHVNQLIVSEKNPSQLINQACASLTKTRGYFTACINLLNDDGSKVTLTAFSGPHKKRSLSSEHLQEDSFPECFQEALESENTIIKQSTGGQCARCPNKTDCDNFARLTKRLYFEKKTYGLLCVTVPTAYCQDLEELSLFDELGDDLAFALHKIEMESMHHQTKETLKQALLMAQMGHWYWDLKSDDVQWSDGVYSIFGVDPSTFKPTINSILERSPWPEDHKRDLELIKKARKSRETGTYRQKFLKSDGSTGYYDSTFQGVYHENEELIAIKGVVQDVTKQTQTEEKLQHQLRYVKGVATTSTCLLKPQSQELSISQSLKALCEAADVSRVYIFENFIDKEKRLCMRQIHEACAPDVPAEINNPVLQHVAYDDGVKRWREKLSLGEPIIGNVCDFPLGERENLEPQGIVSVLVLPLFILGEWRGFIGFDEMRSKRVWRQEEISLLKTATDLICGFFSKSQTEKALKESEKRWRNILVETPQIGVCLDREGKIIFANKHFLQLSGYTEENLLGQNWFNLFIPPEELENIREFFQAIIKSEHPNDFLSYENEIIINEGQRRHVAWSIVITKNATGEVEDVTCLGVDLTEREQSEEALSAANQRLTLAANSAKFGIWDYNIPDNIIEWDEEMFRIYDINKEDFQQNYDSWESYVYPQDLEKVNLEVKRAFSGTKSFDTEFRIIRSSGQIRYIKASALVVRDSTGKPLRMTGVNYDITKYKRAEQALRESEERFAIAFRSSPASLVISEITSGLFIDVNNRWTEMMEYSREEQLGRTSIEIGIWNASNERGRIVKMLQSEGHFRDEPIIFKTKSGKEINALWSAEAISLSGKEVMLSMITDITKLKQTEAEREQLREQLNQSQKMESIGRLAGGVAHDFNNMLNVILGHSELVLDTLPTSSAIRNNLTEIKNAAIRSADLTRQLLAFARKQTAIPKILDLNQTIGSMLKMLRRLIGEDIDLIWHPALTVYPIRIDPAQIDQILANLIVNARDAIVHNNGKISIETKQVEFDEQDCLVHSEMSPGKYALMTINDNGCGMNKETIEKIFEPFFTTKDIGCGTGLGLATVYGIIKQNNGFINVSSEENIGTTFELYFPAFITTKSIGDSNHPKSKTPAIRGHETILLVEDEPTILKITKLMLEQQGYTIKAALTPTEAIRIATEHAGTIHLLITDVIMPEMNGREMAKNILLLYPNAKRVFMSGYTADVIAHQGVLEEGVNFIQKPFTRDGLCTIVRKTLDS